MQAEEELRLAAAPSNQWRLFEDHSQALPAATSTTGTTGVRTTTSEHQESVGTIAHKVVFFDLHGYPAALATLVSQLVLRRCGERRGGTTSVALLVLVVGKGNSSPGGRGNFVLGPVLEKFLDQLQSQKKISSWRRLEDKEGEFAGRLLVRP